MASQTVPVHARKTNPCKTFETADDNLWQDDVPVLATHVNIVQHDGGGSSDGTADVKGVHLVASLLSTSFSAVQGCRHTLPNAPTWRIGRAALRQNADMAATTILNSERYRESGRRLRDAGFEPEVNDQGQQEIADLDYRHGPSYDRRFSDSSHRGDG